MKRILFVALCALLLTLCACGQKTLSLEQTDVMQQVTGEDTATLSETAGASDESKSLSAGHSILEATQEKTGEAPTVSSTLTALSPSTFTGWDALPLPTFEVPDSANSRNLATLEIPYSYGIAENGSPHRTSVSNQEYFDSLGYDAICLDTKSTDKTLYLTFDCGYENGYTFDILDTLKEKEVPAAFFCTLHHLKSEPELISRMITEGHIVGNHSNSHPNFSQISRTQMAQEILDCDAFLRLNFGYTSPFFRFPEGCYSVNSLELVHRLGYTSVFWSLTYVDWDTTNVRGAQYALDTVTARLHPGAIIMLHSVSADNAQALADIIDTAREQGYQFKSLTDFPV